MSALNVAVVALGSGGAMTVLAQTLMQWVQSRHRGTTFKIESGDKIIEITARPGNDAEVRTLLNRLLTSLDTDTTSSEAPKASDPDQME